ncbi:MAG: hypothetical protein TREMPRED_001871 [Tremellales sp. Tagirdzhanova-0007]|nr:MAG: hypothetical protein TREMPRED_001871 [Tremellales sp. Tagirdzhanova-0007]
MARHLPLVRLPPNTTVHRFGTPVITSNPSPLLRFPEQGWEITRVPRDARGWAILGDAEGRRLIVETLQSRHRIHPVSPPPGPFPYINSLLSPTPSLSSSKISPQPRPIRHLAFARPAVSGEFTDFTARYGALQEEDKLSFRQTLSALHPPPTSDDIDSVARTMAVDHLLDLPSVSLSSGQTRRARIAAALLSKPVLLLLEDPMAGLDSESREEVSLVLGELNGSGDIRIMLVLRGKGVETMPGWVTDICDVRDGDVWVGSREEWRTRYERENEGRMEQIEEDRVHQYFQGKPIVELRDVSITYGEGTRRVLQDISWTIRSGDRWHLQGANGSGKTTLLSLILGHHPRSFSLPATSLTLFSKPRRLTPTPTLRMLIGHTSPEIYASFPRGMGMSAMETVGSGFAGVFSRRDLSPSQKGRVMSLLDFFSSQLATTRPGQSQSTQMMDIAKRLFAHFTPPQQALLLFLRAIVGRPPLLILDEPSQGMDEAIWTRCRALLDVEWRETPEQAVVVVCHYEDEVPWRRNRGKVMKLLGGVSSFL